MTSGVSDGDKLHTRALAFHGLCGHAYILPWTSVVRLSPLLIDTVRRTLPPRSAVAFLARVMALFSPTAVYLPSPLSIQCLTSSGLLTTSILSLCFVGLRHPKVAVSTRPHSAKFLCKP